MKTDNKRRKFIQAALMTPVAAGVAGRLHGTPASINQMSGTFGEVDKLILPLARSGVPAEVLTDIAKISSLIESVLTDEAAANAFFSSPGNYFDTYGLDGSDSTLVDPTIITLVALADPSVKSALKNKNYTLLFDHMRAAGVFEPRNPSVLQNRIQQIISENIDEIKKAINERKKNSLSHNKKTEFLAILKSSGVAATEEDVAAIAYILNGEENGDFAVGVTVFLFVIVVVVIAVLVNVAANVNLVVDVNAVVDGDDAISPQKIPAPFTGQFMKLDPAAVRNIRRGYRIAEITRDGQVQLTSCVKPFGKR